MPQKIDADFLAGIRRLSTFTHRCDLDALAVSHPEALALVEQLVVGGHVQKDEMGRHWSALIGHAYVDLHAVNVSDDALVVLPAEIAQKAGALPLQILGGTLTLATAHPEDRATISRLGNIAKMPVSAVFAFPTEVTDLIRLHYSNQETLEEAMRAVEGMERFASGIDLSSGGKEIALLAESQEVVKFLDAIILFAIRKDTSDIHIEPREHDSRVRYRIDGQLREVLAFTRKLQPSVVARLKILCRIDITETRVPTDGRFSVAFGSRSVDFRFSTIPTQYGEKIVVRILGSMKGRSALTLDKMLISRSVLTPFRRVIQAPSGIVLVTGPTGSGKTTTLYAALSAINDPTLNISSVEDPIEIRLDGVNQTQVQPKVDLDFARMLRALLRQDPDVMLIGEIRDLETAKIAAEAALTGHLVFATLHTNTAPEAIVRLQEIGVAPYLLAPSVLAVLGQRLAARICPNCKEPYRPTVDVLQRYFDDENFPDVTFYRGKGCHLCNGTGYRGRVAFHELLIVDKKMRTRISAGADQLELAQLAARHGYQPLRYDGLKKVLLGLTTIEEIEAQTPIEFEG